MFFFDKKNEKAGNRSYNFCPCSTRLLPIKITAIPNNTEVNKILSVGYQT
jgi:hypothetical protein